MTDTQESWYILGAGAIGCLWAAYWRAENIPVVLIEQLPSNCLTVELSVADTSSAYQVETTTTDLLLKSNTAIRRLLISTKAQHTKPALARLLPLISDDATILVVQNGLAVFDLQQQFAKQQVFAGVTTDGAFRTGPRQVTHAGIGTTTIGALGKHSTETLLTQLPTQGLAIKPCDDIERRLWHKFAINCAINPLTVKYQCKNGQLLNLAEANSELHTLCHEILLINSSLKPAEWFETLESDVQTVLELTGNNINSMLQDVRKGRETEIDQLNSLLSKKAKKLGIPCPVNNALITDVLSHYPTANP
jgi:2-dehydropantoate 2-reductase